MDIGTFARQILRDPAYRQSIVARAAAGTLPPGVEEMLWELADGRVPVSIDARPAVRVPTLQIVARTVEALNNVAPPAKRGNSRAEGSRP